MNLVRFSNPETGQVCAGIHRGDEVTWLEDEQNQTPRDGFETLLKTVTTSGSLSLESSVAKGPSFDRSSVELLPPIPDDRRLFCLGGVYTGHLHDAGLELTVDPNQWVMPPNAIVGPEADILLPERVSENVKPAAELCVVIGRRGKYIQPMEAFDYVAGYSISNDVTARTDWPGPMAYKMMDSFSPIGPHVTTADEVGKPIDLGIEMRQDGNVICRGNTAGMRFTLSFLVSYLSAITELQPGDVISCGDPGGVEEALRPGSTVEIEIEDVGVLANRVRLEDSY